MEARKRVVIVTGAGSGFGEETTYGFARQGCYVFLVDMYEDRLDKVKAKCLDIGLLADQVLSIKCDLAEESSYDAIIDQTVAKFGQIDILVNNAGLVFVEGMEALSTEALDKMYKVMLKAPFFLCQKAMPHLKKTQGNIINIGSVAGTLALGSINVGYSIMKAGVEHLTRCVAIVAAPDGVRANNILPTFTRTNILPAAGVTDLDKVYDTEAKNIPLGRVGEVTDIASAIMYLTSDSASFITGASLSVDGGSLLASPWSGFDVK